MSNNSAIKQWFTKYEAKIILVGAVILWSWLFFLNQHFLEGIPHVGDAVAYILEAKFIAHGQLYWQPKIFPQYYDFFKGWGALFYQNGKWFGPYPFGHPLLLALGVIVGNASIIPPLIGTLTVLLIYFICKKLVGRKIALLTSILTISSPFFQMHASSFMSHNSGAFYITLALLLSLHFKSSKHKSLYTFFAGIFWGLLFNTRPLTGIAFFPAILISLLLQKAAIKEIIYYFIGSLVLVLFYLYSNYATIGNAFFPPYSLLIPNRQAFPYFYSGRLTNELKNFTLSLDLFLKVIYGWPKWFAFSIPLFAILKIRRYKIVIICLTAILAHNILYFFFYDPGIIYGPRMWYEILPFFVILSAIGIKNILSLLHRFPLFKLSFYLIFFSLILRTIMGWLTGYPVLYGYYFTPSSIYGLKGFNYTDARLIKEAKRLNIHNAVILVKDKESCFWQWWCYGSVMPQNNPDFNSDIIWGTSWGNKDYILKSVFPNRKFYLADYYKDSIEYLP